MTTNLSESMYVCGVITCVVFIGKKLIHEQ